MALVRVAYVVQSSHSDYAQSRIAKLRLPLEATADGAYASVGLKPCLQAVCASQPELLESDFSVACLDWQETLAQQQHRQLLVQQGMSVSPVKKGQSSKVWEGKGMLSWVLQEPCDDNLATGKYDQATNTLNVSLQLTEKRITQPKASFLDALLQPEPQFHMNLIRPTPERPPFAAPAPSTQTSSPCPTTKNAAALSSALAPGSVLPDRRQILALVQGLLPQLRASIGSAGNDQSKQAIMPLVQTLISYLGTADNATSATPDQEGDQASFEAFLRTLGSSPASEQQSEPLVTIVMPPSRGTQEPSDAGSRKVKQKRKRVESPDISLNPEPVSKKPPAIPAHMASSRTAPASEPIHGSINAQDDPAKPKKQKFDKTGCSNCGTHYSSAWRKRKAGHDIGPDGKPLLKRLCNPCGMHYNRNGVHKPSSFPTEDAPPGLRRSPRQKKAATTQSSPGRPHQTALPLDDHSFEKLLSDLAEPMSRSRSGSRSRAGSAMSTASSSFDATSLFDAPPTDLFNSVTSDFDVSSAADYPLMADDSMSKLFKDWGMSSLLAEPKVSGPSALASDAFSDVDIASMPPSSPPKEAHTNPFAHLSHLDNGDSPNWPAETSSSLPSSLPSNNNLSVPTLPPSDVVWSSEAIAMLSNALLPQSGALGLEESTLQDLLTNLTNGSSPTGESPPASQGAGLNLKNVAQVNANVAMGIWTKDIVPTLSTSLKQSASPTTKP